MADYAEGTRAQDKAGNVLVYQGGQWVPEGPGQQSYAETAGQVVQGAVAGAQQGATSMANMPGDVTPLALAGKGATAIAGALGVQNIAAPDTWAGKAGEFLGGMAVGGVPGLGRKIATSALAHPVENAAAMIDSIGGTLSGGADAIVEKAGRVLKGYLTPGEIKAPVGKAGKMALEATSPAEMKAAKVQKWKETISGGTPEIDLGLKQEFTNTLKKELGIAGPENLTPVVVGDILKTEGGKIGALTSVKGPLAIPIESMRESVKLAPRDARGPINLVLKDLETNAAANGGKVTPEAYQYALTRLDEIAAPGSSAERIQYGNKVLDKMHDTLQANLSGSDLAALKDARYKYKIAKTAQESGAIGADGLANPRSFGNRWDKKTGQTLRGKDVIGRAADTFDFLANQEAHAGNTLQRIWIKGTAQAPEKLLTGAAGGAAGAAGLGTLWGLLKP